MLRKLGKSQMPDSSNFVLKSSKLSIDFSAPSLFVHSLKSHLLSLQVKLGTYGVRIFSNRSKVTTLAVPIRFQALPTNRRLLRP